MSLPPGQPLAGRVVLIPRPAERSRGLQRALEARGARAESRPTIALAPPRDPGPPRRALERLDRYAWVVFTSPAGVRFYCDLARELRSPARPAAGRIAAIGRTTARALTERGLTVDVVADESRAEGLGATLGRRVERGQLLLLVRPESSRATLPQALREAGADVDEVVFYRNVPAPGVAEIARDVAAGRFDVIVFTAPSTLERLIDAADADLRPALARTTLVVIGEVTAAALRRAGLQPAAVADEPSDEGIVRVLERLFSGT